MLVLFATTINSCTDDAAEANVNLSELEGKWAWRTDDGDCSSAFDVTITQTQTGKKIKISNFHNSNIDVDVIVSGSTLSFSGIYGNFDIKEGLGSITNNNSTISIDYQIAVVGDSDYDYIKATLQIGGINAK